MTKSVAARHPPAEPADLHPALRRALAPHALVLRRPGRAGRRRPGGRTRPTYLSQLFTAETGRTFTAHLRQLRMEHAARLLRDGECDIGEAALAVGYASVAQCSHAFRRTFGHPQRWARGVCVFMG